MINKVNYQRILFVILGTGAIISSLSTYFVIAHSKNPLGPDPSQVMGLILLDLVLILFLVIIVLYKITNLWIQKRKGFIGSKLQSRVIGMFAMVAVIPTIMISTFSILFFDYGIQSWFSERVSTALEESVNVAESYLEEHQKTINADTLAIAYHLNILNHKDPYLYEKQELLNQIISQQSNNRSLIGAIIFQDNKIVARSFLSLSMHFERIYKEHLDKARQGHVIILTNEENNRVMAIVKLEHFVDTYLFVGRMVDPKVLTHIHNTRSASDSYQEFRSQISKMQIKFYAIFAIVSLLLLLASVAAGMIFAGDLLKPIITLLIEVTKKVKEGDLSFRVPEGEKGDELTIIGRAFNQMTGELKQQRETLIRDREIDHYRRIFIEAVLYGISSGVIASIENGEIRLFNNSARSLLKISDNNDNTIRSAIPEIENLINRCYSSDQNMIQNQITINRSGRIYTLLVRVTKSEFDSGTKGYITTFDDISDLISAQRTAAWRDVARRIAHEIKNPLTPIRLAASRIKNKYSDQIKEDVVLFNKYTDTIIKHTEDISRMVEEFVEFARMPAPSFEKCNLLMIIKDITFSSKFENNNISYNIHCNKKSVITSCDIQQMKQVFVNLLSNAANSIRESRASGGRIDIHLSENEDCVIIDIQDNGPGFPEGIMNKLTEPYITTRDKGTGLGLAIAKKIITDHNSQIQFSNNTSGALVKIIYYNK